MTRPEPGPGRPVLPRPDPAGVPSRGGRKRDATRDAQILDAAVAVLAEVGYDGMTMDAVAARAKAGKATVYRRWASKVDLVRDAIAHIQEGQVDFDDLPDTGTLRGDLLALVHQQSSSVVERKLKVMSGLASLLSHDDELADAAGAAIVDPWTDALRTLMSRAVARQEFSAQADIETLARVIPSMAAYRLLIEHKGIDQAFLIAAIDGFLLPALRGSSDHRLATSRATSSAQPQARVTPAPP